MIGSLNRLVEHIEANISDEIDVAGLARASGTTEYHLRRMFSSLAGMPLSEYVRRRRMTLAAADLRGSDDLRRMCAGTRLLFARNRNSGSA